MSKIEFIKNDKDISVFGQGRYILDLFICQINLSATSSFVRCGTIKYSALDNEYHYKGRNNQIGADELKQISDYLYKLNKGLI